MKDNLLEVGDVLFEYNQWRGLEKYIIDKTTPKQAKSGNSTFLKEVKTNGYRTGCLVARRVGEYGYAYLSTKELEDEFELQILKRKAYACLINVNSDLLSKEQCESVIALLTPLRDLSKNNI